MFAGISRHRSAGETDGQQARAGVAGAQRGVEPGSADRIVDHVGSAVRLDGAPDVVVHVHRAVRPGGARHGALLLASGHCDDARAHGLADLDGGQADAARRAEHEQGFSRQEACPLGERDMAGPVCNGEPRRFHVGHRVRHFDAAAHRNPDEFGEAARPREAGDARPES